MIPLKPQKKITVRKAVAVIAVTALALLIAYAHGIRRVDPRDLDKRITQQLPPGSDISQVVAFLNSRGISHSEYVPEYHEIQAQIGRSRIGLGGGRIVLKFFFNNDGKLASHTVREILDYL